LKKLVPFGDYRERIRLFRKKCPQLRVMPTEFVPTAISVRSNSLSQFLDLFRQFLMRHLLNIFFLNLSPLKVTR
jgi:hypothetical protein